MISFPFNYSTSGLVYLVTDRAAQAARRRRGKGERGLQAQGLASPGSWWPAAADWGRGGSLFG